MSLKSLGFLPSLLFAAVLLCACSQEKSAEIKPLETPVSVIKEEAGSEQSQKVLSKAEQLLNSMTLKEKVAQLFIIRPEALDPELSPAQVSNANDFGRTALSNEMAQTLEEYPVGGIILFSKNISTPEDLSGFTKELQGHSKIPLFIAVDEEGGSVSRVARASGFDVPRYSSMYDIGKTGDPQNAYEVGYNIGTYLCKYGFNLNFAPVADINTNPDNIVIGKRAFGDSADLVANMVTAEIKGLHDAGIMSCVKHFPGHGDTKEDTHNGYAATEKSWEEISSCELIPFVAGIAANTDMIMVSHITAVNAVSDLLPASLSYEMICGKLRGELSYDGIVITDSMSMGAIINDYNSAEAAVMAISAGADIVLIPDDFMQALNGVMQAVVDGKISEDKINESLLRIFKLKEKYGILE